MGNKLEKRRIDYAGYFMIAPGYLIYLFFILVPVIIGLYYSFTNYNFYKTQDFIGIQNYKLLLGDSVFKQSVLNTFKYAIITIPCQMAGGLLLAVFLNRKSPFIPAIRAMIYIPNVTSMVAISMIWLWIYDPALGILNRFVKFIGMEPKQWLFDPSTAMGSVIFMSIWATIGYNMIVYLSGMQSIPISLYEASEVDGIGPVKQLFHITIPMLAPTTFFLFVTNTVNSFRVFEQVNILTNGGPLNTTTTMVHQIYLRAFQDYRMGYASSMAVVLLAITVIITLINFRYGNQGHDLDL